MQTLCRVSQIVSKINVHQITNPVTLCLSDYSILCMIDGSLHIECQNQFAHYLKADVILLPPGLSASLKPDSYALCLILQIKPWFLLNTLECHNLFDNIYDSINIPYLQALYPHTVLIARYFMNGINEHEYEILSELFNCISIIQKHLVPDSFCTDAVSADVNRNKELLEYLHKHSNHFLKLQDTADAIGLTPQYLAAYFKKSFGCTFIEYVRRLKASKCYFWLIYTQLSDQEISDFIGFQNLKSYHKAIQLYYGCSADDIRKKSRLPSVPSTFEDSTIIRNPEYIFSELPDDLYTFKLIKKGNEPLVIRTDINVQRHRPISDSWRYLINLGFAYQLINPNLQSQLREIQDKVHFIYGRIYRIFDLVGFEQVHGTKLYSFELIYQVIDLIHSLGMIPFLELSNRPVKININFQETQILNNMEDPNEYYNRLLQILPEFIRESCNRYGINYVKKWRFEVCYDFCDNTSQLTYGQYANYFQKIINVIHSIVAECSVGGPGFNTHEPLTKLENVLNSFDSLKISPDFISMQVFSATGYGADLQLSLDKEIVNIRTRNVVEFIHKKYPGMSILVSEFNFCHTARNHLNDTLFQASFLARYLIQNMDIANGFGYFSLSDVSTRYTDSDNMLFGGNGLYSYQGIPKPAFYTYSFFHNLGTSVLSKGDNYIITASSSTSFQGLFFNYAHITEAASNNSLSLQDLTAENQFFEAVVPRFMRFRLHNVQPGYYLVKVNTINQTHGNILYNWSRSGFINVYKKKDIDFFKSLAKPASSLYTIKVTEQKILEFSILLNPQEIHLLLIDYSIPLPNTERSINNEI